MRKEHYSGGLTREQFLFFEMRIVAGLVLKGGTRSEIADEIYAENLFQFPTERMIRSMTRTCFKRLDALESEPLICCLANASAEVAKQVNLGLIGDEFKNCRTHLLKHLDGDIAWRHPEDGIAARAKLKEKRELERQAAREQRVELVSDNSTQVENVPEEHIEPSESECDEFEEEFEMSM